MISIVRIIIGSNLRSRRKRSLRDYIVRASKFREDVRSSHALQKVVIIGLSS